MKIQIKNWRINKTKFNRWHLAIFLISAGAVGSILLLSRAAPAAPAVYLSSASNYLPANTTFTVQVRENSGTASVNAVQADFSYPATLVDFVSIDTTGTAFTTEAPSSGANGQVSIARGLIGSVTGDQLVATVVFKTKTSSGNVPMAFLNSSALLDATSNQDLLGGSLTRMLGQSFVVDTGLPVVAFSAPTSGAVLSGGATVNLAVSASDAESSISKVDIYIDSILKTTLTTAPYSYNWNTAGVALGSHTIQAIATDAVGNTNATAVTSVTLADKTPPTVSITSPGAGTTQSGTISITANASDNTGGSGLAKVEFYINGSLKGTITTAPYALSWDTKLVADGSYSLTAKAYDNATPANVGSSSAVTVNVDNADHLPPSTPGNFRSTGTTQTSISLAWNASTDNTGVTGYRIQRNGTTITTVAGLSFNDTGLSVGTNYSYSIVALDGFGNVSPAVTLSVSTDSQPGDVNGDGHVTIQDLSILLSHYKMVYAPADINKDGIVNIVDLSILLSNYGK